MINLSEHNWKLVYKNFEPKEESLREALCVLGNGYLGSRGAACELKAQENHYPGTYLAGVYNQATTTIAKKGIVNEDFVNCPNWLPVYFRLAESKHWINPYACKIISFNQELDLRCGVLIRTMKIKIKQGYTFIIETRRLVSMAQPQIAALSYQIRSLDYQGPIVLRCGLDGAIENKGVTRYRQLNSQHLKAHGSFNFGKNGLGLTVKTNQSNINIALAAVTRIFSGKNELKPAVKLIKDGKKAIYHDFSFSINKNQDYLIEKTVAIYHSGLKNVRVPKTAALNSIKKQFRFEKLFNEHVKTWDKLWAYADCVIEQDDETLKALRFHAFHLLQSASLHNVGLDAGIGARGLHGEAYRGHIFWDQTFVFPFFNLRFPQISRAVLLYRFNRLDQARLAAKAAGYAGAMFPWQSASLGDEQTQKIHLNPKSGQWGPDYSHNQRHVSLAIAYDVWRYWQESGDDDFMVKYGAELIFSIAQFASSLAEYDPADRRYHVEGVMGPDEFHERMPQADKAGLKDNAYTNLLIAITFMNALAVAKSLPRNVRNALLRRLNITEADLIHWDDVTNKMSLVVSEDDIISQFDGYFNLKDLDWSKYKNKYKDIHRLDRILKAEGKSPDEYKVSKQADLLMLFYLFSFEQLEALFKHLNRKFNRTILEKNYEYYVKRTSHGSTLSRVVYGYIAHLLDKPHEAWRFYQDVLRSDVKDIQGGTTSEGIHAGVMGGSLDILVRAFAGVRVLYDRVVVDPNLPRRWSKLKFRLFIHKHAVNFELSANQITISIDGPKNKPFPRQFIIKGQEHKLNCGKLYTFN